MAAILLDTHVWIWLLAGDTQRMSRRAMRVLEQALDQNDVLVSDISSWEVAIKAAKGKLQLSPTLEDWLQRAEKAPGIRYLALNRQILVRSTRLPGLVHSDPADRMLAASAVLHDLHLATADPYLIDSAGEAGYRALDVRK